MNESSHRPIRGRVLLAYLLGSGVVAGILTELIWPSSEAETVEPIADAAFGLIWYGLLLLLVLRATSRSGISVGSLLLPSSRAPGLRWALLMTVALIALSLGTVYVTLLPLSYIAPTFVNWLLTESPLLWTPGDGHTAANVIAIFVLVALAPAVEELFFRGALFRSWADRWGVRKAAIVSSVIFAVLHVDVIGGFVFGYVMALVFRRTGSLRLPIMIHAANNGVVALLAGLGTYEEYTLAQFRAEWWIGVVGLVVGVPLLVVLFRRMHLASMTEARGP